MSTYDDAPFQGANANPYANAPTAKAWKTGRTRDGTVLVTLKCPHCAGLHTHGNPAGGTTHRVAHCVEPWRTISTFETKKLLRL
jgi:hypothetical protein